MRTLGLACRPQLALFGAANKITSPCGKVRQQKPYKSYGNEA